MRLGSGEKCIRNRGVRCSRRSLVRVWYESVNPQTLPQDLASIVHSTENLLAIAPRISPPDTLLPLPRPARLRSPAGEKFSCLWPEEESRGRLV